MSFFLFCFFLKNLKEDIYLLTGFRKIPAAARSLKWRNLKDMICADIAFRYGSIYTRLFFEIS